MIQNDTQASKLIVDNGYNYRLSIFIILRKHLYFVFLSPLTINIVTSVTA